MSKKCLKMFNVQREKSQKCAGVCSQAENSAQRKWLQFFCYNSLITFFM